MAVHTACQSATSLSASVLLVVLTAALTLLATLVVERVRLSRDDARRFSKEQFEAVRSFLRGIDRWDELDHTAAARGETERWHEASRDYEHHLLGLDTTRVRPLVHAAAEDASLALLDLELLAPETVVAAAKDAFERMRALSAVRYDEPPTECGGQSDSVNVACRALAAARSHLAAVARRHVGAALG